MPILQSRLTRLIEAAEIYMKRDQDLREYIHMVYTAVFNGRMTPQNGLQQLMAYLATVSPNHPAMSVIMEERTRNNRSQSRNSIERERIFLKRQRIAQGIETPRGIRLHDLRTPAEPETETVYTTFDNGEGAITTEDLADWGNEESEEIRREKAKLEAMQDDPLYQAAMKHKPIRPDTGENSG